MFDGSRSPLARSAGTSRRPEDDCFAAQRRSASFGDHRVNPKQLLCDPAEFGDFRDVPAELSRPSPYAARLAAVADRFENAGARRAAPNLCADPSNHARLVRRAHARSGLQTSECRTRGVARDPSSARQGLQPRLRAPATSREASMRPLRTGFRRALPRPVRDPRTVWPVRLLRLACWQPSAESSSARRSSPGHFGGVWSSEPSYISHLAWRARLSTRQP